jgi:hypothetical protein
MKDERERKSSHCSVAAYYVAYMLLVHISLIRSSRSVFLRAAGSSKAGLCTYIDRPCHSRESFRAQAEPVLANVGAMPDSHKRFEK